MTIAPGDDTVQPFFDEAMMPDPHGTLIQIISVECTALFPLVSFIPDAGVDTGLSLANTSAHGEIDSGDQLTGAINFWWYPQDGAEFSCTTAGGGFPGCGS